MTASSHNAQPWKFKLADRAIAVLPDVSRRCPIVDPDDSSAWGCANENLVQAARARERSAR